MRIAVFAEILILLVMAASFARGYQDSWILEGLEIPFSILIVTYLVYVLSEKKTPWLVLFSCLFRFTLLALPILKYDWYQGVFLDPNMHYAITRQTFLQGYLPSVGYARYHGHTSTPLVYLICNAFSLASGVPVLDAFKFLPVLFWFTYPLFVYAIMKKTGLSDLQSLMKYVLFLSSIPIMASTSYIVWGTMFGSILTLIVLYQVLRILRKTGGRDSRLDWIVLAVLSIALASAHSVSSVMLSIALTASCVIAIIFTPFPRDYDKTSLHLERKRLILSSIVVTTISLAWLCIIATPLLVYGIQSLTHARAVIRPVSPNFEGLSYIDNLRLAVVSHGGTMFSLLLTVFGTLILIKSTRKYMKSPRARTLTFLSSYVVCLFIIFLGGLILGIGLQWYDRVPGLLLTFSPVYGGIMLFYLKPKAVHGKISFARLFQLARITTMLLFVLFAVIELYHFQPLVPPANHSFKNVPTDEPLIYIGQVNSVYQRYMLWFSEKHIPEDAKIASDPVTQLQAVGLTSYNFSTLFISYYPLSNQSPEEYDYFLIHFPGKSGAFTSYWDEADTFSKELIVEKMQNSSVLYSNGESFVIGRMR
jgi:hypothetical protein